MERGTDGKNEDGKGRKLWSSMGRRLPMMWVVIAILVFVVVTTWLKIRSLPQ